MFTVLSDTHASEDARLAGPAREAVESAEVVVHAGDFTTTAVLETFEAASERLVAVHGNVDEPAVRERLPSVATLDVDGARIVVVHGDEHGETARAMLGRQEGADIVVSGHSHRPEVVDAGDVLLLNPGSHAQPRQYTAAHAELKPTAEGLSGRIVGTDGRTLERFDV